MHGLRHSNITMIITNGIEFRIVVSRAGHSDARTTLIVYSHYTIQSNKKTCIVIDDLLYEQNRA